MSGSGRKTPTPSAIEAAPAHAAMHAAASTHVGPAEEQSSAQNHADCASFVVALGGMRSTEQRRIRGVVFPRRIPIRIASDFAVRRIFRADQRRLREAISAVMSSGKRTPTLSPRATPYGCVC